MPKGSGDLTKFPKIFDSRGRIRPKNVALLFLLPKPFQDFVGPIQKQLWDGLRRTVRVARWRYATGGNHNPFSGLESQWSLDGREWQTMPYGETSFHVSDERVGLNLRTFNHAAVTRLVESGYDEPIGHELFREAGTQRMSNPRSSLVIGIAALEAAVKQLITTLAPETSWLIENSPSPPLLNLLKKYLPTLPAINLIHGKVPPPPKPILRLLDEAVQLRNKIVHIGRKPPGTEELEDILVAIKDALWILDYYGGHEWALIHLRPETLKALEA